MNAVLQTAEARLEAMTVESLDAVCVVEHAAYSHPWTRANFLDSLAAGYHCQVLIGPASAPAPSPAAAPARESRAFWKRRPARRDGRQESGTVGTVGGADVDTVIGYLIAMKGVDEVHLLNVTVAPAFQRQGWAPLMLDALAGWSRARDAQWLWLEVRASNHRALHVYEQQGYRRVGVRKGYYPAHDGREDAIVMSLRLDEPTSIWGGLPA